MKREIRRALWLEAINVTGALCGIASLMVTLRVGGTLSGIASVVLHSVIAHV